jgi:hypothetical protein
MIVGLILSIFILFEDKCLDNILNSDLTQLVNECSCNCNCNFLSNEKKSRDHKSDDEETKNLLV